MTGEDERNGRKKESRPQSNHGHLSTQKDEKVTGLKIQFPVQMGHFEAFGLV